MIEIQADLHTHSDLSDGKGTLEENVEAAYRQGLGCIACTEHGPRHMKAGISMRQLSELRRRVDRLLSLIHIYPKKRAMQPISIRCWPIMIYVIKSTMEQGARCAFCGVHLSQR